MQQPTTQALLAPFSAGMLDCSAVKLRRPSALDRDVASAFSLSVDDPLTNSPYERSAPLESEPSGWLAAAGFRGLYLQKLGESANFKHEGAQLRELLLVGWKPPLAGDEARLTRVVYRGPFATVTDDTGRTYARGAREPVDASTCARLRQGPLGDQFFFLKGTEPR